MAELSNLEIAKKMRAWYETHNHKKFKLFDDEIMDSDDPVDSQSVTEACIRGAYLLVTNDKVGGIWYGVGDDEYSFAEFLRFVSPYNMVTWNNDPTTTKADVIARLDDAIKRAA